MVINRKMWGQMYLGLWDCSVETFFAGGSTNPSIMNTSKKNVRIDMLLGLWDCSVETLFAGDQQINNGQ